TLSRELRDPVSQGDVIAGLLEQAWQLPLQVGLPFAPDEKAVSLLAAIEEAPEAPVNPQGDGQPGGGAASRAGAAEPVRRPAVELVRGAEAVEGQRMCSGSGRGSARWKPVARAGVGLAAVWWLGRSAAAMQSAMSAVVPAGAGCAVRGWTMAG